MNVLTASWVIRLLRWGTFAALIGFRRWRHLFVFIGAIIVLELLTYQMGLGIGRARPLGVTILTSWTGYSTPSQPVASLAITLIGMAYTLVVPGKHRYQAKWAIGIILVGRLLLSDVSGGRPAHRRDVRRDPGRGGRAHCVPLVHPNDVFPVTYRRGKSAHLDVGGARGEAIVRAAKDQLGLDVIAIKPVGLEGSGGSTPLRMTVVTPDDEPDRYVFAKLYAKNHVEPTGGTSSDARSCTARSRTRRRSGPCVGSSNTRTTRSG